MILHIDRDHIGDLCGIPSMSTNTKLVFHTFTRNNYLPPITNVFEPWSAKAYIKDLIMPPEIGALCRYGNPFKPGKIPIIWYEAGVGTSKLGTEAAPFRKASHCFVVETDYYFVNI